MALAIAASTGAASPVLHNAGAVKVASLKVTFDSAYTTGGLALTPRLVGLNRIIAVNGNLNTLGNRLIGWDFVAGKLLVYTALGVEAVAASDQSTIVAYITVIGV